MDQDLNCPSEDLIKACLKNRMVLDIETLSLFPIKDMSYRKLNGLLIPNGNDSYTTCLKISGYKEEFQKMIQDEIKLRESQMPYTGPRPE